MPDRDFLGEFEHLVLLASIRLGDEGYGVTIGREIEERTGRLVSVGALYATLDRLEQKGFVASRIGEPTAQRGGRARRHYAVTALGRAALRDARARLAAMWQGLDREIELDPRRSTA